MGYSLYLPLVALALSRPGCTADQIPEADGGTETGSSGNSAAGAISMAGASDTPTTTGGTSSATGGAATDVAGTSSAGSPDDPPSPGGSDDSGGGSAGAGGGRSVTGGSTSSGDSGGRSGTGGRTGTGGTVPGGGSAATGGRTELSTGGSTGSAGSGGQTASGGTSSAGGACGNGVVDNGEACDGADLGGYTCANLGSSGGALACSGKCAFDTSSCAPSKNILTNGGFEYGLPCFNYWEWGARGNYDFSLSSDAYEGSYALEIRCVGSQCGGDQLAALFSLPIEGPAGQDYRLTAQAKCSGSGDIYFANAGDYFARLTCDGQWHEVSAEITTTEDNVFFYLRNTGTGRVLFDDLVLTYADGTAPNPPLLHAGEREVAVDGQRVLVDGKPYFARGFFNVPYRSLETVESLGANTIVELTDGDTSGCYNSGQVHYFDRAYELGLNLLPTSTMTARLDLPSIFPGVMKRYSRHLANIGWFLADEPDMPEEAEMPWLTVSPEVLTAEYEQVKKASPLPVMVDLQRSWDTVDINAPFVGAMDIWMAEPYGGTDNDFWGIGNAVDNFNSLDRKPIWLAQDGISPATLIVPKSYWAIVQGVTGLVFFTWTASDSYAFEGDEERLAAVRQLFDEIAQLEDIIFEGEDITSEVSGYEEVGVMGRSMPDRNVLIAARATDTDGRVTFRHASVAANQRVEVLFENRTLTASDGYFVDSFAGKSRHVYSW